MTWLDGGHNGGKDTWITNQKVLKVVNRVVSKGVAVESRKIMFFRVSREALNYKVSRYNIIKEMCCSRLLDLKLYDEKKVSN